MWAVRGEGRLCVRHAEENVAVVVGTRAMISYGSKTAVFALARPKPFSLSSSRTMVNLFKNNTPDLVFSCDSSALRMLTCVLGSIFLLIVWLNAITLYQ